MHTFTRQRALPNWLYSITHKCIHTPALNLLCVFFFSLVSLNRTQQSNDDDHKTQCRAEALNKKPKKKTTIWVNL